MIASKHVRALLIVTSLIFTGCSSGSTPPRASESRDCGGPIDLAEVTYRQLFANNASSIGRGASAYFIAAEGGADPSPALLARFASHKPPVKAASKAQRVRERIIDPATGQRALLFRIDRLERVNDNEAVIEAGYFEGQLSASWTVFSATCSDGRWALAQRGPVKIS